MNALNLLPIALLHMLPKSTLAAWLAARLSVGPYRFQAAFSGRVALHVLARHVRERSRASVALIPEYICNVVPRALQSAGWQLETYRTDELLEGDWETLSRRVRQNDVGLLLGASVFGSSGLLDDVGEPAKLALLRAHGTSVIIDLAQDVRLLSRLPAAASDVVSAVVSFNDKSFPGVMGGGIVSARSLSFSQQPLSLAEKWRLYVLLLRKVAKHHTRALLRTCESDASGFEYSGCDSFPYQLEDRVLTSTKLQHALAILGTYAMKSFTRRKGRLLQLGTHLPTRFAATAAYLIVDPQRSTAPEELQRRKRKLPYAVHEDPRISLRADQMIVHNKGFADHG